MQCSRCGRHADFIRMPEREGYLVVMMGLTHADYEQMAYYCSSCGKCYCGQCCLPKWQELKRKEGLSGQALAAKLEADPDALFSEMPTCPKCKRLVDSEAPKGMAASRGLASRSVGGAAPAGDMPAGCIVVIVLTVLVGLGNFAYKRWDRSDQALAGHQVAPEFVTFAPDGKRLLSSEFKQAILWDAGTGKEVRRYPGHNVRDSLLAISNDGRYGMIIEHPSHRMLKAWDLDSGNPIANPPPPGTLGASAEYSLCRAANNIGGTRKLRENGDKVLLDDKVLGTHPGKVRCLTITPDGRWGCSACDQGVVIVWDLDQAKELRRWDAAHPKALLLTPDGKRLAAICHDGVQVWHVDSARELRMCVHWDEVKCVALTSDGRLLATGSGQAVRLWKLPEK